VTTRFGLFGTGYWAAETQGPALLAHPDVEFAGVWGRNPAKAARLADRFGARPYDDVDALIADVDAIAVSLPPDVQAGIAERAARAGKDLLLDKPLALDLTAADRVVGAVEDSGVASTIFFTNRFQPSINGFLDDAAAEVGWHGSRILMFGSIFRPDSPYQDSVWREVHGGLWDIGPHALSVTAPVLGPVDEVAAMAGPRSTTHLLLRHAGGAVSTFSLTLDAPQELFRLELFGEPGTRLVPDRGDPAAVAFGRAIDHLLARGEGLGVHFGREVVAVLTAAETAYREGRTVTL
jgi:predicted dehydrogenase